LSRLVVVCLCTDFDGCYRQGQRRNYAAAKWLYPETIGQYSYIKGIAMTLKTHGTVSSAVTFSSRWALLTTSVLYILTLNTLQAYKHIFTSPSSVKKEPKATRSGNARIHGMTQVTPASIAYIATQVILSCCINVINCLLTVFFMFSGSLCIIFISSLLPDGYGNRLGNVLHLDS